MTEEHRRLDECASNTTEWKKWGPYLSERQWGTVREDQSDDGNAWTHFPHDHARSRAYRWGEDGIAGISDGRQILCFAMAFWNGSDPILKERLFGLTGPEGNHAEDVKEYYYYLDSTPTHSYMKHLYKYPQRAFPYRKLVDENRKRGKNDFEYELVDTGIFSDDRYFDVITEYAKNTAEDLLIRITVVNRSSAPAHLHVLPHLFFRNRWQDASASKPVIRAGKAAAHASMHAHSDDLGRYTMYCESSPALAFTDNETNRQRIDGKPNRTPYVKDGINRYITKNESGAINPAMTGTKAAAIYKLTPGPGGSNTIRLRLCADEYTPEQPFADFDQIFDRRIREADDFYSLVIPDSLPGDAREVMRQALAGMLWTKQFYYYPVADWIGRYREHLPARNLEWGHLQAEDIHSMPDKWEYPWYAVWDTAFHTLSLELVDPAFAKHQLTMFLTDRYMHPNGQLPAYEWNFGDVNPPVHAFATIFLYNVDKARQPGGEDIQFLQQSFAGLEKNFRWWIEHKDPSGENVFHGGFLGLDNIGVFDRSKDLPTGGHLEQADGNAWMALYAQNMFEIALELAHHDKKYEDSVIRYLDHFLQIASAMDRVGDNDDEMWDAGDGFFYDVLRFPDGRATRLKVRSLVGLLPLGAVTVLEPDLLFSLPSLRDKFEEIRDRIEALSTNIACPRTPGVNDRHLLAVCSREKLESILRYMLDEQEFLSPYGVRSMSKYHLDHPYTFHWDHASYTVRYTPGESDTHMFGGNSNWRGPVWMPANIILIRALLHHYAYYGDTFKIECPTGSGQYMNLFEIAREIAFRLMKIFLKDEQEHRPVFGKSTVFQTDRHWRDHLLFYEYFHGDNGAGIGASHQTGWTGNIAVLFALFGTEGRLGFIENMDKFSAESVIKSTIH